jgi:C1A family cysteine protease/peptidoglycan hydrolase-like protein with peptidoglycan-binding domain
VHQEQAMNINRKQESKKAIESAKQNRMTRLKRKGLGWVPDYPEIDDSNLSSSDIQVNGRLKQTEATSSVERLAGKLGDIAEVLIQALNSINFQDNSYTKKNLLSGQLRSLKEEIDQDILENLEIFDVIAHQVLKEGSSNQEVLRLKSALQYLFSSTDVFRYEKSEDIFTWEWLSNSNYDRATENLVKRFQEVVKIEVDGIVGLETYTAINTCLSASKEKVIAYIKGNYFSERIKKIPLSSFIPEELLKSIRVYLLNIFLLQQNSQIKNRSHHPVPNLAFSSSSSTIKNPVSKYWNVDYSFLEKYLTFYDWVTSSGASKIQDKEHFKDLVSVFKSLKVELKIDLLETATLDEFQINFLKDVFFSIEKFKDLRIDFDKNYLMPIDKALNHENNTEWNITINPSHKGKDSFVDNLLWVTTVFGDKDSISGFVGIKNERKDSDSKEYFKHWPDSLEFGNLYKSLVKVLLPLNDCANCLSQLDLKDSKNISKSNKLLRFFSSSLIDFFDFVKSSDFESQLSLLKGQKANISLLKNYLSEQEAVDNYKIADKLRKKYDERYKVTGEKAQREINEIIQRYNNKLDDNKIEEIKKYLDGEHEWLDLTNIQDTHEFKKIYWKNIGRYVVSVYESGERSHSFVDLLEQDIIQRIELIIEKLENIKSCLNSAEEKFDILSFLRSEYDDLDDEISVPENIVVPGWMKHAVTFTDNSFSELGVPHPNQDLYKLSDFLKKFRGIKKTLEDFYILGSIKAFSQKENGFSKVEEMFGNISSEDVQFASNMTLLETGFNALRDQRYNHIDDGETASRQKLTDIFSHSLTSLLIDIGYPIGGESFVNAFSDLFSFFDPLISVFMARLYPLAEFETFEMALNSIQDDLCQLKDFLPLLDYSIQLDNAEYLTTHIVDPATKNTLEVEELKKISFSSFRIADNNSVPESLNGLSNSMLDAYQKYREDILKSCIRIKQNLTFEVSSIKYEILLLDVCVQAFDNFLIKSHPSNAISDPTELENELRNELGLALSKNTTVERASNQLIEDYQIFNLIQEFKKVFDDDSHGNVSKYKVIEVRVLQLIDTWNKQKLACLQKINFINFIFKILADQRLSKWLGKSFNDQIRQFPSHPESECEDRKNLIEMKRKPKGRMSEGKALLSTSHPKFSDEEYSHPKFLEYSNPKFLDEDYIFFTPDNFPLPIDRKVLSIYGDCPRNKKRYFYLPNYVDQSYWFTPVRDQGSLNTCTAFSAISLIEYYTQKKIGKYTPLSPLFLYKTARNLMQCEGDTGSSIRESLRAMEAFGIAPEAYWPYVEGAFDEEPPASCYAYAQSFQAQKYFRIDNANLHPEFLLFRIKAVLACGFPSMFGLTLYNSSREEYNLERGYIPFPSKRDGVLGGHVLVAVGYQDDKEIPRKDCQIPSEGALLIRNSWGKEWGQSGYGWLPYDYVTKGLTADWWSLLKAEWFDTGQFGVTAREPGTTPESSQF